MAKHGKKYQEVAKLVDKTKAYTPQEAIELAKKITRAQFDETVELHLRMGLDPRNAAQQVRGVALLPHGLGKTGLASLVVLWFAITREQASLETIFGSSTITWSGS